MFQFKIPEKQYILSLDSLDLTFLSQYVQKPSDGERLLWSKSVEESPAFYQVEILSEEVQDEDAFIEPYETYLCYICNMDVPKKYYKQHNNSTRHQNYKKLVEKVLENVEKQKNIDIESVPDKQEYDIMFYCETCCKVVTQNNKQNHKKSNYHIQSIENEKISYKFIEMYINKKNTEDDMQSELDYENDLNSEFSSSSESDWCDLNTNSNTNIIKTITNNIKKINSNNIINESKKCNGIEEVENFQKYLKEMVSKYNLDVKLPSFEGNSVIIVTPKGYKEKITIDAFHSYKKMNGFAFCLSCQKRVQENIPEHSASEEHVRNIFQPINDNFAREVASDKQYSHCLICNERVLKTSNHVNVRPKHKKYLEQIEAESNERETSPESFSDMKSSSISNEESSETNLSKKAIDSLLPAANTITGTLEEKLNEYRKQFSVVNASKLKCLVCDSIVPYVDNNIITHVEGRLHRKACDDLFLKNSLKKIAINSLKSVYYCNLCNKFIHDFLDHIKLHKENKPKKKKETGSKRQFKKYVYEDPLDLSPKAIECRKKYKVWLQRNHIIPRSNKGFHCKVCLITLTRISEIDHMFGERHRLALASNAS